MLGIRPVDFMTWNNDAQRPNWTDLEGPDVCQKHSETILAFMSLWYLVFAGDNILMICTVNSKHTFFWQKSFPLRQL